MNRVVEQTDIVWFSKAYEDYEKGGNRSRRWNRSIGCKHEGTRHRYGTGNGRKNFSLTRTRLHLTERRAKDALLKLGEIEESMDEEV